MVRDKSPRVTLTEKTRPQRYGIFSGLLTGVALRLARAIRVVETKDVFRDVAMNLGHVDLLRLLVDDPHAEYLSAVQIAGSCDMVKSVQRRIDPLAKPRPAVEDHIPLLHLTPR
jgi:hypothetical protein